MAVLCNDNPVFFRIVTAAARLFRAYLSLTCFSDSENIQIVQQAPPLLFLHNTYCIVVKNKLNTFYLQPVIVFMF